MGGNGGRPSNGSRRGAFHADKRTKHQEAKVSELQDRFVLGPANSGNGGGPRRPEGVSLFDQQLSAERVGRAPVKPPHPNAAALEGLSAAQLRDHYKLAFGRDPGQMGKARLREAFLRPGAPKLGSVAAERGL